MHGNEFFTICMKEIVFVLLCSSVSPWVLLLFCRFYSSIVCSFVHNKNESSHNMNVLNNAFNCHSFYVFLVPFSAIYSLSLQEFCPPAHQYLSFILLHSPSLFSLASPLPLSLSHTSILYLILLLVFLLHTRELKRIHLWCVSNSWPTYALI